MKKLSILLLTLLFTACNKGDTLANSKYVKEVGNDNFTVVGNLIVPDFEIDGVIDENDYANPSFTIEMGGVGTFQTRVKAMVVFGEVGLTVGFISQDKYLASSTDYNDPYFVVNSDNIEFYIDTLNNKGKVAQSDDFAFLVNPEEFIEMRNGTGSYWSSWSGVVDYAVQVNGTINNDSDIDIGWTCELFLPYVTFGFDKNSTISVAFGCRDKMTFDTYSQWIGNGPDPQIIDTYLSLNKDGPIVETVEDLTINNGKFEFENNEYVSMSTNSLGTFENRSIQEGTLSIDMYLSTSASFRDNGITLQVNSDSRAFWERQGTSYYFLFMSKDGNLILGETYNGYWHAHNVCENPHIHLDNWNTFKVVMANSYFAIYLNDVFVFAHYLHLQDLSFGIRAGAAGVKYRNISTTSSTDGAYVGIEGYHVSSGAFDYANVEKTSVTSTSNNSILTSNTGLASGTLETTMTANSVGDNGIIFRLNDFDKSSYWEEDVSYYFFFINIDGLAFLGKVTLGRWETIKTEPIANYNMNAAHTLKVEFTSSHFKCYIDSNKYIDFTDLEPIDGTGYGLRAGSLNTTFTLFGGH